MRSKNTLSSAGTTTGSSRQAVEDVAEGKGKSIDGSPAEGKRVCIFDIEMEGVKQLKKGRVESEDLLHTAA